LQPYDESNAYSRHYIRRNYNGRESKDFNSRGLSLPFLKNKTYFADHLVQNCREEYGEHTCDKRRSRGIIHSEFPQFEIEDGFTEEDELWTPERESEEHIITRAKAILGRVFDADAEQCLSISHFSCSLTDVSG
jgi:hypothetical protein